MSRHCVTVSVGDVCVSIPVGEGDPRKVAKLAVGLAERLSAHSRSDIEAESVSFGFAPDRATPFEEVRFQWESEE